jgi:hypothetical protein
MYHKTTDLTLNLSQNYEFKVEYHKTTYLRITKLDIYNPNIKLVLRFKP